MRLRGAHHNFCPYGDRVTLHADPLPQEVHDLHPQRCGFTPSQDHRAQQPHQLFVAGALTSEALKLLVNVEFEPSIRLADEIELEDYDELSTSFDVESEAMDALYGVGGQARDAASGVVAPLNHAIPT